MSPRPVLIALGITLVPLSARAAEPNKFECIAANDAAQDLRRAGKLREAREKLALCVAASCPGPVREDCAQRLTEVDHVMPSVIFEVKDGAGNDVAGVTVTMDGQQLPSKLSSLPVQVDPGEHRFVFGAEGLSATEKTIVVREGDQIRHESVVLASREVGVTARSASAQPFTATPALVAFGVGGAGLVLGGVFVAEWADAKSQANKACGPAGNQCPGDASSRNSTIVTDTAVAVAGFGVATAGAIVGALLLSHPLATAPQGRQVFPLLGVGYAGLGGRF